MVLLVKMLGNSALVYIVRMLSHFECVYVCSGIHLRIASTF